MKRSNIYIDLTSNVSDSSSSNDSQESNPELSTLGDDMPPSPDAQTYLDWMTELDRADAEEAARAENILFSDSEISVRSESGSDEEDSFIADPPTPEVDPTYSSDLLSSSSDEDGWILDLSVAARNRARAYADHVRRYYIYDLSIVNRIDRRLHASRIYAGKVGSIPNI